MGEVHGYEKSELKPSEGADALTMVIVRGMRGHICAMTASSVSYYVLSLSCVRIKCGDIHRHIECM